jgi:hypothetical protein
MNFIFALMIAARKVAVYLDDIVIFAKTLQQLHQYMHEVFSILQKYDLFLCTTKCKFEK